MPPINDVAYAVASAALVLFAGWLVYLSPRQRATRALAALLVSMAMVWSVDFVLDAFETPVELNISLTAVALTLVGISAVYFLCVYPRPRGWIGRSAFSGWLFFALGAAATALFLARPDLFIITRPTPEGPQFVGNGPLFLVMTLWSLTVSTMMLVFAVDVTRTPPGPIRRALLLVLAGFVASGIVWPLSLALNDVSGRLDPQAIDERFSRIAYIVDEVAIFATLAAAAIVILHAWRSRDPTMRREGQAYLGFVLVCIAATVVVTFSTPPPAPEEWPGPAQGVLDALAGIAIAACAGYALLKHRLFDIDVKLRWTISRGTLAATFLGIFVIAAQLAQNFLSEELGWLTGGIVAGLMLFAIAPLQRVAERVAVTAVPMQPPVGERKVELYRLALALALSDRRITREEERHLARLAEELGVTHTEALTAREAMEAEMGTAQPQR